MSKGLEALKYLKDTLKFFYQDEDEWNITRYPKDIKTIEQELKALEIINKAYEDYANHRISEYELIMIVGENTTY